MIDYDHSHPKDIPRTPTSQGTMTYRSLESLWNRDEGFVHTPGHVLESLLFKMLSICHFTDGPGDQPRIHTPGEPAIPSSCWFRETHPEELARTKSIHLTDFDRDIDEYLASYWKPFSPYLKALESSRPRLTTPSMSTRTRLLIYPTRTYFARLCGSYQMKLPVPILRFAFLYLR